MHIATLISVYGPKSPEFSQLIGECQALVHKELGTRFEPYDLRQVHCTIASLDRVGESGIFNQSFHEFRGRSVAMDLAGLLASLRALAPMEIQIGGFADGPAKFASRGQSPCQRSFSMQDGKAVLMGWPISRGAGGTEYPPRLETLRRGLQRFGILHRYHRTESDVDNDFYLRIGLYDPDAVLPAMIARTERLLREFLSRRPPLILPVKPGDITFALSDHHTLPPDSTPTLAVDDPTATPQSIVRLFRWENI